MTLEDQAKIIQALLGQINGKEQEIQDISNLILLERLADNTVIKFSQTKKQHLINQYLTLKGELETLVSQLPG